MRRIFTVLLFFASINSFSQRLGANYDSKLFQSFILSETKIVLTENEEADEILKDVFEKYWTITPFAFIHQNQIETYRNDPKYSIILSFETIDYTYLDTVTTISLIAAQEGKRPDLKHTPSLYTVMLDKITEGNNPANAAYRFSYIFKSMNAQLEWVKRTKSASNDVNSSYFATKEDKILDIQNRTVLIAKELSAERPSNPFDDSPFMESGAFNKYPYKYEILPLEEILKICNDPSINKEYYWIVTSVIAGGARTYFTVYDPSDMTIVMTQFVTVEKLLNGFFTQLAVYANGKRKFK